MNGKAWSPADTATTHRLREAPLTPRSERPFSTLDAVLLQMIQAHEGKPCPTLKDIREWTGMPRRRIWAYLTGMQYRGLIELECRGSDTPRYPCMRRMRIKGRKWTEWTERRLGGHHQLYAGTKLTSDRMTG